MGQCPAPCQGNVDKEEYRRNFEKALAFLNGQTKGVLQNLEEKMMAASAEMNFEGGGRLPGSDHSVKQVTGAAEDYE